jgi:hypothetical protein
MRDEGEKVAAEAGLHAVRLLFHHRAQHRIPLSLLSFVFCELRGKAGQPFTTFSTIVSLPTTLSYYTKSLIAEWNFTA